MAVHPWSAPRRRTPERIGVGPVASTMDCLCSSNLPSVQAFLGSKDGDPKVVLRTAENGYAGVGKHYSEQNNLESYEGRIGPNCRSLPSDNRGLLARQDDPQATGATGDWMKPRLGCSEPVTRSTVSVNAEAPFFRGRSSRPTHSRLRAPCRTRPARACATAIVGSSMSRFSAAQLAHGLRLHPSRHHEAGSEPRWALVPARLASSKSPREIETAKRSCYRGRTGENKTTPLPLDRCTAFEASRRAQVSNSPLDLRPPPVATLDLRPRPRRVPCACAPPAYRSTARQTE